MFSAQQRGCVAPPLRAASQPGRACAALPSPPPHAASPPPPPLPLLHARASRRVACTSASARHARAPRRQAAAPPAASSSGGGAATADGEVFIGRYGAWTLTDVDKREVWAYRAGLTVAAAGARGAQGGQQSVVCAFVGADRDRLSWSLPARACCVLLCACVRRSV
jgi:hypothetical protein